MDLGEGSVQRTVRWKMEVWNRMREYGKTIDMPSQNELFNFLVGLGLDSINGKGPQSQVVVSDDESSSLKDKVSDDDSSSRDNESIVSGDDDSSSVKDWDFGHP